jgi:hypothetical protein
LCTASERSSNMAATQSTVDLLRDAISDDALRKIRRAEFDDESTDNILMRNKILLTLIVDVAIGDYDLIEAVNNGNIHIVSLLLAFGANPNTVYGGFNAMDAALANAGGEPCPICDILADHGGVTSDGEWNSKGLCFDFSQEV